MLAALPVQLALWSLVPFSWGRAIENVGAGGFYTIAQTYPASQILSHFPEIADVLPTHPRANMPGKTLFFSALVTVLGSTEVMAWVIILLSNLGGVLVFALAKHWFRDSLAAFYALVLYLFLPARLYFFPGLNVLSPIPMLLVFWLTMRYLESRRISELVLCGLSLYALFFFEPLPLAALPILAALVAKLLVDDDLSVADAMKAVAWVLGAFLIAHLVLLVAFGFNVFDAFFYAFNDARRFNAITNRPYSVWIVLNLRDFFLNMGVPQSVLFLVALASTLRTLMTRGRSVLRRNDVLLVLSFATTLVTLDLVGVNRGETVRLWIFLGVFLQLIAAQACAIRGGFRVFATVLAISVLQTAVCLTIVRWQDLGSS